jgi:hypothetical protein
VLAVSATPLERQAEVQEERDRLTAGAADLGVDVLTYAAEQLITYRQAIRATREELTRLRAQVNYFKYGSAS